MDAQLYEYTKSHWIINFKWVNYMVYELYLNKAVKKIPVLQYTYI